MAKCCPCLHASTDQKIKESKSKTEDYAHTKDERRRKDEDEIRLDENFIIKHFKLPPRPLYLEPFRRPIITFPMAENSQHFSMARKSKINQQILDGYLDPSEAITAPPIFPYTKTENKVQNISVEDDVQYVFDLPQGQYICPVHNKTMQTPRILGCCTCLKSEKETSQKIQAGRPYKRPKPWLLSRHTDFDLISQW